jgi:hypothetical protein
MRFTDWKEKFLSFNEQVTVAEQKAVEAQATLEALARQRDEFLKDTLKLEGGTLTPSQLVAFMENSRGMV